MDSQRKPSKSILTEALVLWVFISAICAIGVYILSHLAMLVHYAVVVAPTRPSAYVDNLSTDPATYSQIDTIAPDDLSLHSYGFERNQLVDALPDVRRKPNVADAAGNVPAFKMGDDVFVITYKGRNESSGLAISNDPEFKTRIENIDPCFQVEHIRDNIYQWTLDLERYALSRRARRKPQVACCCEGISLSRFD